ncbi:MAG: CDP-alcohol phosphatidyltransferase family protein [Coriobacteriales bacterium]
MTQDEMTGADKEEVLDKVLTAPNVITLVRLLLLPLFLWLLFATPYHIAALVVYAVAASTDWVDGQVARRTHQVSKLGKLFDPFVDRLLIAVGVIAIFILGRLPLWILVYLIVRDLCLLLGGRYLLSRCGKVPPVVYVGKFATAFIMIGFCLLLLGLPQVPGLGLAGAPGWLPGFGTDEALLGIWFVYAGLICSIIAFLIYVVRGARLLGEAS